MAHDGWTRRDLLGIAALAAIPAALAGDARESAPRALPARRFGRSRERVPILGLGGAAIGSADLPEETAIATVRRAVELGVTYVDTASQYGDGLSEERIGRALEGGLRDRVFLATKTLQRSRKEAEEEIRASLRRLRTERVDLLQIHAVNDLETLEEIMSPDGSLHAALRAKERGLARRLGITGHTRPEVLRRALEMHPFDSVLVPLGPADEHLGDFLRGLVPFARTKGAAVIAMKVLAAGRSVGSLPVADCLRYALSLPVTTAIVGMGTPAEVVENARIAAGFRPMDEQERAALVARAGPLGNPQVLWWKKT